LYTRFPVKTRSFCSRDTIIATFATIISAHAQ